VDATTATTATTTPAEDSTSNTKMTFGYPTLQKAIEHEPKLLSTLIQRLQSQDYALCLNSLDLQTAMLRTVTEEHQNELPETLEQLNTKKYIVVSLAERNGTDQDGLN
jgi:engulfment/cell motility protein 1